MYVKTETFAFISLNEEESKLLKGVSIPEEFDTIYIEQLMKTHPSNDVKSIAKQIYVTMMTNDAWFCRLTRCELDDEVAPVVKNPDAKQKILFLNTMLGFELDNPVAVLVEIPANISVNALRELEGRQMGASRVGGKWPVIMADGNIPYKEISRGRKKNYSDKDYDVAYYLIQGNH